MAKRSRAGAAADRRSAAVTSGQLDPGGPRRPCPCGSGKRYKACHGDTAARSPFVSRPFAGLPAECDWVAMREFVPAATAAISLLDGHQILVCSLLPMAAPAMVRSDGSVWLGLQVQHDFGDPSRDLAHALEQALAATAGSTIPVVEDPGTGQRLQDLVDPTESMTVEVHAGFDFWVADVDDPTGAIAASLETANEAAWPTQRLSSVDAAYWTRMGQREFLRWVLPHDEDRLLDALARLHGDGTDSLGEQTRLIGSFRAYGLVVPVWELPRGTGADPLEQPAAELGERLAAALADDAPLTAAQRSARNGLASRQLTIH